MSLESRIGRSISETMKTSVAMTIELDPGLHDPVQILKRVRQSVADPKIFVYVKKGDGCMIVGATRFTQGR